MKVSIAIPKKKKYTPEKLTRPLKRDYFSREYIDSNHWFSGTFVRFQGISMSYWWKKRLHPAKRPIPHPITFWHRWGIKTKTSSCLARTKSQAPFWPAVNGRIFGALTRGTVQNKTLGGMKSQIVTYYSNTYMYISKKTHTTIIMSE